jgi:polygalacturonase
MQLERHTKWILLILAVMLVNQGALAEDWNILRFGAVNDSLTVNTQAIQNAIDSCSASGGGRVIIPSGRFVSGTIYLKSHVTLHLSNGAMLIGSLDTSDYQPANLVRAENVHDIGIDGAGIIDGRGYHFWKHLKEPPPFVFKEHRRLFSWVPTFMYAHTGPRPSNLVYIKECNQVNISGIVLRNSENWTLHLAGCRNVNIEHLTIRNPLIGINTDGIDLTSCENVTINNCNIYTADDAICLKSDREFWQQPCRNIAVTNCILTSACNAFKIGTATWGAFSNITFSNSVIKQGRPTDAGWLVDKAEKTIAPGHYGNALAPISGIAIEMVDGGSVRGVSISNIEMDGARTPLLIRLGNRGDRVKTPGTLEDVAISNILAYGSVTASSISGIPSAHIKNVTITNCTVHMLGGEESRLFEKVVPEYETHYPEATMWGRLPVTGFFIRHVSGISMRNVRIFLSKEDNRPAVSLSDVSDGLFQGFYTSGLHNGDCIVKAENAKDISWLDPQFKETDTPYFLLKGPDIEKFRIRGLPGDSISSKIKESGAVKRGQVVVQ